ncbi:hypothetical protein E4T56_gene9728 [Termitomyces sp. T112]|nr:hypothetical protein E4T56_gene9728 [Termitomyces sp. T112]
MTETTSKRRSPESDPNTRPSKVVKAAAPQSQLAKKESKKGRKRRAKLQPSISAETFNSAASLLHVNLTHTAPTNGDPETEVVRVDPGFIGNVSLAPNTFSTGSFGWKGSKRLTVELPSSNRDGNEEVQVMLSINATVIGSKPAQLGKMNDAAEEEEINKESKED